MKLCGLDLAGKPENPTGICFFIPPSGGMLGKCETRTVKTDEEILRIIEDNKPDCIAVDAPFYLPVSGAWRPCDMELMRRGLQPLSPVLPSMRMLVLRATVLVKILREKGYRVIETFSSAVEKILGLSKEPKKNKDEYEALLCAITAKAYMEGRSEDIGGIILPK